MIHSSFICSVFLIGGAELLIYVCVPCHLMMVRYLNCLIILASCRQALYNFIKGEHRPKKL